MLWPVADCSVGQWKSTSKTLVGVFQIIHEIVAQKSDAAICIMIPRASGSLTHMTGSPRERHELDQSSDWYGDILHTIGVQNHHSEKSYHYWCGWQSHLQVLVKPDHLGPTQGALIVNIIKEFLLGHV